MDEVISKTIFSNIDFIPSEMVSWLRDRARQNGVTGVVVMLANKSIDSSFVSDVVAGKIIQGSLYQIELIRVAMNAWHLCRITMMSRVPSSFGEDRDS